MKVFVGLSGGVDSSVTAALLKAQGYEVTGVFMKNWTRDIGGNICPWRQDLTDAKRVAVQLGIDFKVFDFQDQYRQRVVDYMLAEYQAGRTPNPDVMCNQHIKFDLFLQTALDEGADMIATGHYARVKDGRLLKGLDETKDQSYFLHRVTADALAKTIMPIGELKKTAVRDKAKDLGLVTARKPDSQGICFVGEVGIKDFLGEFIDLEPGNIKDASTGVVLGRHEGAALYTIGQRHGLGLGGGLPYYVTHTDIAKNEVLVTTRLDDERLWSENIQLKDCHWIHQLPVKGKTYSALVRYRAKAVKCQVDAKAKTAQIRLAKAQRAVAPGQSLVVYDGDEVLGGGIISRA